MTANDEDPRFSRAQKLKARLWSVGLLVLGGALAATVAQTHHVASEEGDARTKAVGAARHVNTPVAYATVPGSGGDHHPVWWDCGTYAQAIPDEHAVHSLEHGAVWLTYRPDVSAATVDALKAMASRTYMLLSPVPEQESPVTATAWGAQLAQARLDVAKLEQFVLEHRLGPGAPESGGSCTNGTTEDLVKRG